MDSTIIFYFDNSIILINFAIADRNAEARSGTLWAGLHEKARHLALPT